METCSDGPASSCCTIFTGRSAVGPAADFLVAEERGTPLECSELSLVCVVTDRFDCLRSLEKRVAGVSCEASDRPSRLERGIWKGSGMY